MNADDQSTSIENVSIRLGVDDKTRHFFRAATRTEPARSGGTTVLVPTKIHDGRAPSCKNLTLEEASFELVSFSTALSTQDFYRIQQGSIVGDDSPSGEKLQQQFYREVQEFVKEKLGCDVVRCFHSQVRNEATAGTNGVQGYAGGVPHTDSSAVAGDELALQLIGQYQANRPKQLSKNVDDTPPECYERYLYLNLWRNISEDNLVQNNHLAVLDERSTVKPDDYLIRDFQDPDNYLSVVQYELNARHANQHQWYYFPRMTHHEAILFKQTDSDWTLPSRTCFHMSVEDPTQKKRDDNEPVPPSRESIEVRMICYWKTAPSGVNSMPTWENTHRGAVIPAEESGNQAVSVASASFGTLLAALLLQLPFVGRLAGMIMSFASTAGKEEYSGKPADYASRFTNSVKAFSWWPAEAQR